MKARSCLASALLLLALGGCARLIPPPREPITDQARRALTLLEARWRAASDLRTRADIRLERGEERQRLVGILLAKPPASLRFEALSPFGQPLLLVAVHDGQLVAYDTVRNEAVVGPATVDTAIRLLQLPFEPDDLVGVLTGHAVPPRDVRVAELLPPDDLGPSLSMIGAVHQQRVWMDFETGVVRQLEITGGRYEARVTYRREADGRLAGFDLSAAGERLRGSVRYRDPVMGVGLGGERFRLTVPETARVRRLH